MAVSRRPGDLWRVSNYHTLDGFGGLDYSGRWNTAGRRIVYLADSPAGALFETLVHLQVAAEDIPPSYTLLRVQVASGLTVHAIEPPRVDWKEHVEVTRQLGDAWLRQARAPLVSIPSAVVPRARNYLLNPLHPKAGAITVAEVIEGRNDPRLFRIGPL